MNKKQTLLEKFNEAFMQNDVAAIVEKVTDDIRWHIIGHKSLNGLAEFEAELKAMASAESNELEYKNIFTHEQFGLVEGTVKSPGENGETKSFAFCDIYTFDGSENPKIRKMTSYVVEENK